MTRARSPALSLQLEKEIAIITFDLAGESVNKFSATVIAEFDAILSQLERDASVMAAVLVSGKPDSFIVGADIDAFLEFRGVHDAEAASTFGHQMMRRIERSRAPVVAAIHGACLGGGLEMAMACAYRIATDCSGTVFGFPETKLGLIPGAGGTQRLPKVIGLRAALDLILSARNLRGREALQIGLVDELVHPTTLRAIATQRAKELAAGTLSRSLKRRRGGLAVMLEGNPVGRALVFRQARRMALKKSRGHYPAPLAALEAIEAGYRGAAEHGYAVEARLFGDMALTSVSKELVFLFYATTSLKQDYGVDVDPPGPLPVNKLVVLGAGFMGAGIAAASVMQGLPVRFKDTSHEQVGRGIAAVRDVLDERLTRQQITRQQFTDQLSLLSGTIEYTGFGTTPLVIEAVFEDMDVKHRVLSEVEPLIPRHAIFASNTSTIPIAKIAAGAARPERVIGMHFFSPVNKMPLLEVIVTPGTDAQVVATAVAFGRKLGKMVIIVNDSPGFFVNRILAPYLNEAGRLLDEGVPIDAVDGALVEFGFPVGPITLLDEVGLDVAGKSGAIMATAFGDRMQPSKSLTRMLAAGRLGRKSRRGFYAYDSHGKKGHVDPDVYTLLDSTVRRTDVTKGEIQRRCTLAMVNEAVRCLEEGVVRQPRDGDVGAVFGIGFPPFRGGPYRYVDALSANEMVIQLRALDASHPGRYVPCEAMLMMAREGKRFYPATGKPI